MTAPRDLVVLGAMKAGTTTLHKYLEHSGQFALAAEKEVPSLSDDGLREHRALERELRSTSRPRAFVQPNLLTSFLAVERVPVLIPSARFVALLRDPVIRAHSHFSMQVKRGRETRTFEDAVAADLDRCRSGDFEDRDDAYVSEGMYGFHLSRWEQGTGQQPYVIPFELVGRPAELAAAVADLLEVGSLEFGTELVANRTDSLRPRSSLEIAVRSNAPLRRVWHLLPVRSRRRIALKRNGNLDVTDGTPDRAPADDGSVLELLSDPTRTAWTELLEADVGIDERVRAMAADTGWTLLS